MRVRKGEMQEEGEGEKLGVWVGGMEAVRGRAGVNVEVVRLRQTCRC
jgi:hypothetical protein